MTEEQEDDVTKMLKNMISDEQYNRSMTYNTGQNEYQKKILKLSAKNIGQLVNREALLREEAHTQKLEEINKRSREILINKLANKKEEQILAQKMNESLKKLRNQIEANGGDSGQPEVSRKGNLDSTTIEIAEIERKIEQLSKIPEPFQLSVVDVYNQFKKNNFRNIDLPAFKSNEEGAMKATSAGKPKDLINA